MPDLVKILIKRGVKIINPATITIDPAVDPGRIADGVTLFPGTRLMGAKTSIGPDCSLGRETPLALDNCQLGARVNLGGGYCSEATFLNDAGMGVNAYVRPGTLVEEEATCAHTVGLKQTLLFPYATLGSHINLCDCLLAGGSSRKNHSEVGSSYIHFNYTPHQDKATPSMAGDVPRGVMLDQTPVFLGGQGGLVGPIRVAYGVVIPAGIILRNDVLEPGLFVPPVQPLKNSASFRQGMYRTIHRIVLNNLIYIGNIVALQTWYRQVRSRFIQVEPYARACYEGALERLRSMLSERIDRLGELAEKMPDSLELARDSGELNEKARLQQAALIEQWPRIRDQLAGLEQITGRMQQRELLLDEISRVSSGTAYLDAIKGLTPRSREAGTAWLQSMVDSIAAFWRPIA